MRVLAAARRLRDALDGFDPGGRVAYVYHPLGYAWDAHAQFVRAYGEDAPPRRRGLFVGMNPGAWGAMQTGVPFGDAPTVQEWMGITGRVEPPARTHPKRPVLGFAATRRDGSGAKLYNWARARCGTAERFFREFYVINDCPLVFFDADGKNVTPPQLPKAAREAMWPACDAHLVEVVRALEPEWVLPLGAYAEKRVRDVAAREGLDAQVRGLLHPSPAHPANNFGWGADLSFLA